MIKVTVAKTVFYSPDLEDMSSFYFVHGMNSLEDVLEFDKQALIDGSITIDDLVEDNRDIETKFEFEIVDTIK